jgi:cystathionine gamma-synthase
MIYYPSSCAKKTVDYAKLLRNPEQGTFGPSLIRCGYKAGFGGLFSLLLQSEYCTTAFFDNLAVAKGPSLGTSFTLACPYTLLAHYTELDWAARFGLEAELIRVSVGLEPIDELKAVFVKALNAARDRAPSLI